MSSRGLKVAEACGAQSGGCYQSRVACILPRWVADCFTTNGGLPPSWSQAVEVSRHHVQPSADAGAPSLGRQCFCMPDHVPSPATSLQQHMTATLLLLPHEALSSTSGVDGQAALVNSHRRGLRQAAGTCDCAHCPASVTVSIVNWPADVGEAALWHACACNGGSRPVDSAATALCLSIQVPTV